MRASSRNRTADRRAERLAGAMAVALTGSLILGALAHAETSTPAPTTSGTSATQAKAATHAKPAATTTAKPASAAPASAKATVPPAATTSKPAVTTTTTTTKGAAAPAVAPTKGTPTTTPTTPARTPSNGSKPTPATAAVKPVPTAKHVTPGTAPGKTNAPLTGSAIVQSSAHLDEQVTYQYNALGRRDPFQSLLSGEYVGADVGGDAAPDVGGLKVVGIVWGDADQFALVEDARGDSHILRRGDKVMNGVVESLKRDAMVVNLTVDGQSQSVTIPLTRKGDKTNANR